jgi:cbb3-type cytochrome oxidase subunit 3
VSDFLAFAEQLLNAGGWTVVVFMVLVAVVGLWRGWWVLRPWYREKADEAKALRELVDKMTADNLTRTATDLARERRRRRTDVP